MNALYIQYLTSQIAIMIFLETHIYRVIIKYTPISIQFLSYTNEDIDMRSFVTPRGDRVILFDMRYIMIR